jgi:hypothetical protein
MMCSKTVKALVMVLVAVLCLGTAAAAPTVKFKYKDVMAPDSIETDAYAVNNDGVVAGDYVDATFVQHAMLLKGTNLTTVDKANCSPAPGTTGIQFFGINGAGDAVGWCTNTNGVEIAFKYSNSSGKLTSIKIKGALLVNANGINDAGNIVGTYVDAGGLQHGFLLIGNKLKNLDPPGVVALATGFGINNKGVVTAYGQDANGAYVSFTTKDKGKTYKPFHAPDEGPVGTAIHHINNNGDITATYFDADNNRHGVLLHNGKYSVLDDPNGVGSTRGNGINDKMWIVGRYSPADGDPPEQGYIAKPK